VAFAGQLVFQKNIPLLIDAWLLAKQRGAASRLLLIGDGPDRKAIEARLGNDAPPESWHVTGWQADPSRYLALADVFMMTSRFEGLPLALVEAAGSGIPCVLTPFNGAHDVAEKASWVAVASEHAKAPVAETLERVLTDLPRLRAAAVGGRQAFRAHFSPERMARDLLEEAVAC
jgi:glycosyltransferase involved in cell wall biosynthesis